MDYDGLYNLYLMRNQQKTSPYQGAYWLKPEDIYAVINSFSPYDLYAKPNYNPTFALDYPTNALAINRLLGEPGIQRLIAFVSQEPKLKLSQLSSQGNNVGLGGIYAHENAHLSDLRRNSAKMWSFPNHGFTTYQGLTGGLLQSEFPALVAEERYDNLLKLLNG